MADRLRGRKARKVHRTPSRPRAREHRPAADGAGRAAVAARRGFAEAGRIRQRVARAFFPADQTAIPGWVLAVITVGCAALALARLGSLGMNTLWAEDGQVFYQGALNHPLHAFFEPYRGYWQITSRLVAAVVALFPVSQVAAATAVADAIMMGLFAALVYRACGEHIRNPWLRAVPAIVTAVCPVGQDTWGTITNLLWPMFFVAFVVLLWNPRRPVPIAVGATTVVLLALTSPFGLLLAPLAVVRVIALGRDRGSVIPLAFLGGVAGQSVYMAIAGGRQVSSAILPGLIERRYINFVAGQGFFGARYPLPFQPLGNAVMIALLAALVLVAASGRLRPFAIAALALAYSTVYFAVLLVLTVDASRAVLIKYPARFNMGSLLLLAYAVAVLLDAGLRGGTGRWAGRIRTVAQRRLAGLPRFAALVLSAVLVGCLAWSVTTTWNLGYPRRQSPTWSAALANARAECGQGARTVQVPITPAPTHQNWHVTLTCAQLGPG